MFCFFVHMYTTVIFLVFLLYNLYNRKIKLHEQILKIVLRLQTLKSFSSMAMGEGVTVAAT